jgi:predicted aspartyl protease
LRQRLSQETDCLSVILWQTTAALQVECAESVLREVEVLVGGKLIEACGLLVATKAAEAPLVENTQSVLRMGEALVGGQFVQSRRLTVALRKAATALLEENAEAILSKGQALVSGKLDQAHSFLFVDVHRAITLDAVVDSGASDVSVPADIVSTLIRTKTVTQDDFLGKQTYVLADGSKVPSQQFRIRSLKVGHKTIENVVASIASVEGTILLGQSFLSKFKSWSVDNEKHTLVLR